MIDVYLIKIEQKLGLYIFKYFKSLKLLIDPYCTGSPSGACAEGRLAVPVSPARYHRLSLPSSPTTYLAMGIAQILVKASLSQVFGSLPDKRKMFPSYDLNSA